MTKIMYGQHAVHVPAWFYVQGGSKQQDTVVIMGASKVEPDNPLRFGSTMIHQFVLGEIIVRPHLVVETDRLKGTGAASLLTSGWHVWSQDRFEGGNIIIDNRPTRKGTRKDNQ